LEPFDFLELYQQCVGTLQTGLHLSEIVETDKMRKNRQSVQKFGENKNKQFLAL
jgi:hypothetical protein